MNGAENGAEQAKKSDERSGAVSRSRKNERNEARSGRSRSGTGAVSGLNLPLMSAHSLLSSLQSVLCTLQSSVHIVD